MSFKLNDFEDNFPRYIVNRGYNYYRDGLIIQSLYDKQSMTYQGIVSGTENYLVKIKITTDNLVDYTSCNCPYHSDCKHITAYLYYIRELKESNINGSSIKNNYYDDLYNNIIAFYESNYDERSLENMIGRFKFTRVLSLEQNFHENVFNLFLKLLNQINKDDLRAMINTYLYFHYQTSPYHIQELLRKNKVHKELYFMYYEFILVEMFNYRYIRHNNIFDIFAETFEYTNNMLLFERTNNTDFIEKLINHFEYERVMQVNFSVIINFLKERTLEKLKFLETAFTHEEISILLSMNFFDEIDLDLAIYLKEKYNIDTFVYDIKLNSQNIKENLDYVKTHFEKSAISYLLNNVLEDKLSRREIINKLETIRLIDPNYNFYNDEKIYVMALDNGVIDNQNSFKMFQEGLPNYLKNIYKPKHLTINYHKDNHYGLLFYLNEQTSEFKFSVIDNNFNVLLIAKIESGRIEVETVDDYYTNHTSILNTLFVSPIKETADRAFNDLYQKVIDIQEERFLESRTKKSKELVEQLSLSLLDKPEVILENKVELDIIMSFGDMFIHHYKPYNNYVLEARDFIFGTKIGNSRMYLVKDNVDLLTDIEEKRFHKYGAQLAFDHNIKSFSEVAVSYLDVLSKYHHFDRIKNNLGLMLSHRNSYELLKLLKGKTITLHNHFDNYDYETYYILKDEYEVLINLTEKNMTSNLSNDIKKGMLVKTSSFDFILNKENNTLTFVNYKNNKVKVLSDFILENESFRTDLVLNELVEQVIPLINNDIVIEDSLKTKVIDLKVNVDSYFDYDDKLDEITVKTKYLRNDLELNKEELNNQKLVISNYTNILETFGFIDNKIKDQAYIINFLGADLTPLKSLGNVYISEAISNKKVKSLSKVQVSVTLDGSILRAAIESVDLTNSELKEVLNAYKRGKKYVILRDNVILTSDPSITNLNEFLELNELSDKDLSKPLEKPVYEVFKLETGDGVDLVIEDKIKTIMDDITNYNNLEYNKPVMYDLLKDYQKSGFKWLKTLAKYNLGGILADDMGLGKTLQVISYLESEDFNLSIVISPKSLIYNWENEINKFKATFKSLVYVGSIDDRKELLKKIESNKEKLLIITSYDTLRNDLESFKEFNFSNIILDEAQAIKTRTALKTKAVKELKGLNKFVLTGTPIENSIFDLWSIFDFIMPGYLYSHSKFNSLGLKVHDEDAETLNFLIQKTKPFILRRVKKDVLKELPEKEEQVLYTTFDGENRKVYDSYLLKVQEKLNDKEVKQIEILSDLMRLRQLCISPSLVYDNYIGESLKIDAATNLINEAIESNHKVLVFSTFVKALDLLKANYQEEEYFVLTGKTEASDRVKMTEEFNDLNSNQKVFFISLKAGGTGLNLTGADIVIHLDPWWNLAAENQATDRAHRIGQENTVNVYKVVMKDSIEERIIELQNKKKDLFDKMIDHDEEIAKIGKDDYSYILK